MPGQNIRQHIEQYGADADHRQTHGFIHPYCIHCQRKKFGRDTGHCPDTKNAACQSGYHAPDPVQNMKGKKRQKNTGDKRAGDSACQKQQCQGNQKVRPAEEKPGRPDTDNRLEHAENQDLINSKTQIRNSNKGRAIRSASILPFLVAFLLFP